MYDNLWPAYEDLFDSAEEHTLGLLLLKWVEMVTSEDQLFQKVYIKLQLYSMFIYMYVLIVSWE